MTGQAQPAIVAMSRATRFARRAALWVVLLSVAALAVAKCAGDDRQSEAEALVKKVTKASSVDCRFFTGRVGVQAFRCTAGAREYLVIVDPNGTVRMGPEITGMG